MVTSAVPQVGAVTITNGAISIGSGGSLNVRYPIEMNTGASNTATINVTNGGVLAIGGILPEMSTGTKTINIDSGIIRPGFKSALVNPGATTVIGAGGATFDTPGTDSMFWSSSLSGSGNVTKTGTGTLILRPPILQLGLADQNPNFSGEFFIDEGTVDVQREHGVFGTAGSTRGGMVHMTDSTLVIHTAYPIGLRKELPADFEITGHNVISNMVDRASTEIRMQGSLTGDGTLEYIKPMLGDALGIDFENRANPNADTEPETPVLFTDNTSFTGRIIANGNWAVRFNSSIVNEVLHANTDFPNAIFELADPGAWLGKRGTWANQLIRLGGVDGVADPENLLWSRLLSSIAGEGALDDNMNDFNDLTYELGSNIAPDAVFNGRVTDVYTTAAVDVVTMRKVGSNTQTFGGPNTYSGTTTINGGTLLINGTHSIDAFALAGGEAAPPAIALPVGDYTVNAGGTLGGTGSIGSESDPVNVNVVGGTVNPGASIGTLTVEGAANFDATSHFAVEISGSTVDLLIANALNIASGATLDILTAGSVTAGQYTIAQFGSGSGMFALNAPAGFSVSYATAGQIILTAPDISGGVPGDYNENGIVDAADFTIWRDRLGQTFSLANENSGAMTPGVVDQEDYAFWKSQFGNSGSGSGSLGTAAVPEPTSLALSLLAAVAVLGVYRRPQ
jgi:autotransporter-associated beta strand protein